MCMYACFSINLCIFDGSVIRRESHEICLLPSYLLGLLGNCLWKICWARHNFKHVGLTYCSICKMLSTVHSDCEWVKQEQTSLIVLKVLLDGLVMRSFVEWSNKCCSGSDAILQCDRLFFWVCVSEWNSDCLDIYFDEYLLNMNFLVIFTQTIATL